MQIFPFFANPSLMYDDVVFTSENRIPFGRSKKSAFSGKNKKSNRLRFKSNAKLKRKKARK